MARVWLLFSADANGIENRELAELHMHGGSKRYEDWAAGQRD
jgi:hypothetical protein